MAEKKYEDNRFHKARFEIAKIGDEMHLDVGDAAFEYAHRNGWDVGEGGAELAEYQEFTDFVKKLQDSVRPGETDNAVNRYFHG